MSHHFPYTQIRIARPTHQLEAVVAFYTKGLGLAIIGQFTAHNGYSGVMIGLPDDAYHLEFTHHDEGSPCAAPSKDNLLVLYMENREIRNTVAQRIIDMGYTEVEAENPYWKSHGITIEDPDGWRIVLMDVPTFKLA